MDKPVNPFIEQCILRIKEREQNKNAYRILRLKAREQKQKLSQTNKRRPK